MYIYIYIYICISRTQTREQQTREQVTALLARYDALFLQCIIFVFRCKCAFGRRCGGQFVGPSAHKSPWLEPVLAPNGKVAQTCLRSVVLGSVPRSRWHFCICFCIFCALFQPAEQNNAKQMQCIFWISHEPMQCMSRLCAAMSRSSAPCSAAGHRSIEQNQPVSMSCSPV